MNYPDMYVVDNEPKTLCQGDIFLNFDEHVLPNNDNWQYSPYIVLTYSCDLERPKEIVYLAVSPVSKFEELLLQTLKNNKTRKPEKIDKKKNTVFGKILGIANYKSKMYFFCHQ